MKIKRFFPLTCSEAAYFCDKAQYGEASPREKLKLQIHCIICRACRKYSTTNKKLSQLFRKAQVNTCTRSEKENFKAQLKAENPELFKKQK